MKESISSKKVSLKKIRWKLFLLGLFKIPQILFVNPKIISIDSERCIVKVKLKRRTKNHLNSMYFGSMAVGADVAAGIHAFYLSEITNCKISLAFKSFSTEFFKRAETDILFICHDGKKIFNTLENSKTEGKRMNETVEVLAFNLSNEVVAKFAMELSLKVI
ncbi:MAG: DUF4442 domain-containing protein [Bacteroidetes bacterium]|nr:DUF4442 domain-containing protein [Bacteroidota bacterium]